MEYISSYIVTTTAALFQKNFKERIIHLSDGLVQFEIEMNVEQLQNFKARFFEANANIMIVPKGFAPKAIFFDMDSTVVHQESIVELARWAGKSAEVHQITEAAMEGRIEFIPALRQRVATLKGLDESIFEHVFANFTLLTGMKEFALKMQTQKVPYFLISGGFNRLAAPLAAQLSFTEFKSNELAISSGKLTGEIVGDIVDAKMKAAWVRKWCQEKSIDLHDIVVIGDGANDLEMMALSPCPIGINPKPILRSKIMGIVDNYHIVSTALFKN